MSANTAKYLNGFLQYKGDNKMLDIFTTGEIASGIYLILIIIFVFWNANIRPAVLNLLKVIFTSKLIIPFCFIIFYAGLFIYFVSYFKFWNYKYIKDIAIWVIFIGIPLCYKAIDKNIDEHYFSNTIINNFKFIVLVEFFTSSFTFSLWIELLLQMILFVLYILQYIASTKDEIAQVKKLLDGIITIIGIWILIATLHKAITTYKDQGIIDYVVSFLIPVIFSFLYLPVAYLMTVYSSYESLFVHMRFKEPKDKKILRRHRLSIIRACGLSYKRVRKFHSDYMFKMYVSMPISDFDILIDNFKADK